MNNNEEYLIDNVLVLYKEQITEQTNEAVGLYGLLLLLMLFINFAYSDYIIGLLGDENYISVMIVSLCVITIIFVITDRRCMKLTTRYRYTIALLDGADTNYIEEHYYIGEKRGKMWVVSDKAGDK